MSYAVRRLLVDLAVVVVVTLAMVASTLVAGSTMRWQRADATSTVLCKGFSACAKAGYGNAGYSDHYRQMWWRMYAGHNCTNYVAYRMIRAGMSTQRPWSGSGDARNWGYALSDKVTDTPVVGAVAWWKANHVAYVEEVVDADTIVVSEDHWGGDFDWRRITRASGGWPTGFILLAPGLEEAPPEPELPMVELAEEPRLDGYTPHVGHPVSVVPGRATTAEVTISFQWSVDGQDVPGATTDTYEPAARDAGGIVAVRISYALPGHESAVRDVAFKRPVRAWSGAGVRPRADVLRPDSVEHDD